MTGPLSGTRTPRVVRVVAILVLAVIGRWALAAEQGVYSPYAANDFPENLYWGDLHVHTKLSADAYTFNNRLLSPEDAYRFARGEAVRSNSGQPVRLSRPLDFLLISDHATFFGMFQLLDGTDMKAIRSPIGRRWKQKFDEEKIAEVFSKEWVPTIRGETDLEYDDDMRANVTAVWHQVTALAEHYNDPGEFTAFIGYEWTSNRLGNNLHRNILFKDGAKEANQIIPFGAMDSVNPEDLWQFLDGYEAATGGSVMAIPHNANASNGMMFFDKTFAGDALTEAYAQTRMRWEPVVEVTQIKGDGEAHPYLSPDDRFADFESWDEGNFGGIAKEDWMLEHEYARGALKVGLQLEQQLGANPFKFGLLGSSDSHTALAAVEENSFFGKFGADEPSAERIARGKPGGASWVKPTYGASGYAAVWARENTREALFAALQQKAVYATTGPRIEVRFFGGWDFDDADHARPDYAAIGYRKGVPMGGDLASAPNDKSPRFLIAAAKDPRGANLERVQVVKGWLDAKGEGQEKVWDVVLSDGRKPDRRGRMAAPIRSTVDVKTATYTNTVGAPQLATVWQDPDFDPAQRAFYYVRVLEIPTPRWTTYDAVFYGVAPPEGMPLEIQERAYTSPIWYTP